MAWNNEKTINFIDAIHLRVCLWDNRISDFKDRVLKKYEWTAIGHQFQISHEEAAKKFKNLRTYFNNELKKMYKKKSDSGACQESNWFAYKAMLFLKDTEEADSGLETETQSVPEISADDSIGSCHLLPPPPAQSVGVKKRKIHNDHIQYQNTCEVMDQVKQKLSKKSWAFGQHVNDKLLTYSPYVRNQVQFKISTILYEADMGFYDERSSGNSSSARRHSPMPSASTSYRQNTYSPTPSPVSYHAPSPSPSPVSPISNYNPDSLNTESQSQYSPISTHTSSIISNQDNIAAVTIKCTETTQFNVDIKTEEEE